jgi:hypothetical protein
MRALQGLKRYGRVGFDYYGIGCGFPFHILMVGLA